MTASTSPFGSVLANRTRKPPSGISATLAAVPPATTELDFVLTTDPALEARVWSELNPDEPFTPEEVAHEWKAFDSMGTFERFAIRASGQDVGYASAGHFSWDATEHRYVRVSADFLPDLRSHFNLSAAYEFVEGRALAAGARDLIAHAREGDDFLVLQLRRRGYAGKRIFRWWELDLAGEGDRLVELATSSRRRMKSAGVELLTVTDAGGLDAVVDELVELHNEANLDTPRDEPAVAFDTDGVRTWFSAPGVFEDRFWMARSEGRIAGLSYLMYFSGRAWTGWTGTLRRVRGRGVARALKLESLVQAMDFGVRLVRTENDGENAPILHINQELGYRPIPGMIQFHRPAGVELDWNYKRAIFRDLGV
jgi:hypothetical protein